MVRVRSKAHSQEFMQAFTPVRRFLTVIGQLPFHIQKRRDGTFAFRFKKRSFETFFFGLCSLIFFIVYSVTSVGLFALLLDFWEQDWYKANSYNIKVKTSKQSIFPSKQYAQNYTSIPWEYVMLKNYMPIVLVTHALLTMTCAGILFVVVNETQYVHYFNYWNKVVQAVHMNPTHGVKLQLRSRIIASVVYVIAEVLVFVFMVGLRAVSGIYACLLFKPIIPNLAEKSWFIVPQALGLVFIMYGHLGARAILIQFVFFCLLLKNVAGVWNERLRYVLKRTRDLSIPVAHKRHEFRCLLKDHLVIVQLFKMTESTFALILTTFYLTQLICLIFLAFTLFKLLVPATPNIDVFNITAGGGTTKSNAIDPPVWNKHTTFQHKVEYSEGIITILLFPATGVTVYSVTAYAHEAYAEAMRGFQVIRRHGLMDCIKSERNFMYSMVVSFARNNPLIVSANGYFLLNKALLLSIVGSIVAYFILLIQFPQNKFTINEPDYRLKWGKP